MSQLSVPRPGPDESAPFYHGYIAQVTGEAIGGLLVSQLEELERMVAPLDDAAARYRYAPGKWSVKEVLGHLADAERIFSYRMLRIGRGDTTALPGFDENGYVPAGDFDGRPLAAIIGELRAVRQATLALADNMPADGWTRLGEASGKRVSARALLYIIAGHLTHHGSRPPRAVPAGHGASDLRQRQRAHRAGVGGGGGAGVLARHLHRRRHRDHRGRWRPLARGGRGGNSGKRGRIPALRRGGRASDRVGPGGAGRYAPPLPRFPRAVIRPMELVIDTSAIVAVLTAEPTRDRIIARTQGAELLAPGSVHWETGNALSALVKRRRLKLADVQTALAAYARIPIRLVDIELDVALELADRLGLYAYDAYLMACARRHSAPLLTLDPRLGRVASEAGVKVLEV